MKTTSPEVGMNILSPVSKQYVTIHEVVPQAHRTSGTIYRLRVTPANYSDHPDRSRWTTCTTLFDFGSGWEAY